MKKLFAVLLLVALVLAAAVWTAGRHTILTDRGVVVVPKRFLNFSQSLVDARGWKSSDFDRRPALRAALSEHGYGDLLEDLRRAERREERRELRENLKSRVSDFGRSVSQTAGEYWDSLTGLFRREPLPQPVNDSELRGTGLPG